MGQLTRAELVVQGQAEAGQAGKNTRLLEALVLWELSMYKSWPFSYIRKRRSKLALAAGTTAISVGAGEGGITNMIQRIINPIWVGVAGYTGRGKANIMSLDSQDESNDEDLNDPATVRGMPHSFKIRHILSTVSPFRSAWSLVPVPVPDKAYLLSFDYTELPITAQTAESGIPLYPNDQTMKKFVEMMSYKWAGAVSDPDYQTARDELGSMVVADRLKDGQGHGNNDTIGMDPTTFI